MPPALLAKIETAEAVRNPPEIIVQAMSERAECVMLNKGPHIIEAVSLLGSLLPRMEKHQSKKTPMPRALHSWDHELR